jgi:hypothetical protein
MDAAFDSLELCECLQCPMGVVAHFPISICPPNNLDSIKRTPVALASAQIQCVSVAELAGLMGADEEYPRGSVGNPSKIKVFRRIHHRNLSLNLN